MNTASSKALGDFQTPPALVAEVLKCLKVSGDRWARVLEPTCGRGNFIAGLLSLEIPPREIQAIELSEIYIQEAQRAITETSSTQITFQQAKLFNVDLSQDLNWSLSGPLLVLGNPPWVTNSQLGILKSDNLPEKTNLKRLRGIEALTGHSNFDLTEFIWIKLLKELVCEKPTIALLCKVSVARNVLQFAASNRLPINNASLRMIDAQKCFGASVGACLFSLDLGSETSSYQASVYPDLNSTEPENVIEVVGKHIVSNIESYRQFAFVEGECQIEWRQGLKHDAASVMELSYNSQGLLKNKLEEPVDVEPEYVFPLLKGTDLFHGKLNSMRRVIVPQKFIGENTEHLKQNAPKLWSYLNQHLDYFSKRKSSIYKGRPLFSIFGIGDYSFSCYKVGISGLHKDPRFLIIPPIGDRPVMLDDTCYFIPCSSLEQATLLASLLNSPECIAFIHSRIFLDAKRPITKKLLQCINLLALSDYKKSHALLLT